MGCVVGCGLLGGSVTPLASNLSAMAGSSLASQPSHFFFLGSGAKEKGQGKYGPCQGRYDTRTSSYLNYNM